MEGWTWANTLTLAAIVISLAALSVSIYNARRHPKPKIVPEWWDRLSSPVDDLPYTLGLTIWNHGDAPATDVRVRVSTMREAVPYNLQKIWFSEVQIKSGESATYHLPLQPVHIGADPYGVSDERFVAIDPASAPIRPKIKITWRQQPFTWKKKMRTRAPKLPAALPPRRQMNLPRPPKASS